MKGEWTIISETESRWPICLGRHQQDESSPIWVWGDWKLALKICKLLNRNINTKTPSTKSNEKRHIQNTETHHRKHLR